MNYLKNTIIPYEEEEQIALVDWLELNGYRFTAIPNSTYTPSRRAKARNKRMGLRAGLPDLLVVLPKKGLVFIELKRQKGGVVSPEQKEWIDTLKEIDGVEAIVAKGAQEAINFILSL